MPHVKSRTLQLRLQWKDYIIVKPGGPWGAEKGGRRKRKGRNPIPAKL